MGFWVAGILVSRVWRDLALKTDVHLIAGSWEDLVGGVIVPPLRILVKDC